MSLTSSFSARDILDVVKDHLEPNPAIYWTDMLLSAAVAYTAAVGYLLAAPWSLVQVVCFIVAGFAFYRLSVFTHEIQHFREGTFQAFRTTWNIVCGIPMMIPSFLYDDHKNHHVNHSYGTPDDSEYYPLGAGPIRIIVVFLLGSLLLPVLGPIRFLIVAPIRWLVPPLRPLIWTRMSSLSVMNPRYRRAPATPDETRSAFVHELACFVVGWSGLGLILAGIAPWIVLPKLYVMFLFWQTLNHVRTLAAHRYRNSGGSMTYTGQLLDTNTFPGSPFLTELWAPLGMRYHALHHLVPSMPYHEMGKAHRRLMRELPDDSPYRRTVHRNLFSALFDLVRDSWTSGRVQRSI